MNTDELIEKCRLSTFEVAQATGHSSRYLDEFAQDYKAKLLQVAEAQLRKAIPIIEAEARKAERERIERIIGEAELPIGTTSGSIQEACRRAILQALKGG